MLILSGIAESMRNNNNVIQGQVYTFNLFCKNEQLDEQLADIENFMIDKGWDNIIINAQEVILDQNGLEHTVLLDAYNIAKQEGISGVVNTNPITELN